MGAARVWRAGTPYPCSHRRPVSVPQSILNRRAGLPRSPEVLEHALLSVRPGQEDAFQDAFQQAKAIIAGMPGFGHLTLSRCLERAGTYLLLVEWDDLEDHTVGFRGSPEYQRWRQLLHHFYDPFPVVEHYEQVLAA